MKVDTVHWLIAYAVAQGAVIATTVLLGGHVLLPGSLIIGAVFLVNARERE